jgi:hypothetical protein
LNSVARGKYSERVPLQLPESDPKKYGCPTFVNKLASSLKKATKKKKTCRACSPIANPAETQLHLSPVRIAEKPLWTYDQV